MKTFPILLLLLTCLEIQADEKRFAGVVSSATPEATAAGVAALEAGGNAIDAAVAVSLALTVSEPAGSGIGGQTVMLVRPADGKPFVIHGTTWSPSRLPDDVEREQLSSGRTASTVPSTLRVLDLAHRRFGSGKLNWPELVAPAVRLAREGIEIGPFRARAFRFYGDALAADDTARGIFMPAGAKLQSGDRLRQPLLATTLERIARDGAMEFYNGNMAAEIAADMQANGGWITAADLASFPDPPIVPPLQGRYRGDRVYTLPPPFGGWVVLQILNLLEWSDQDVLGADDDRRRLALVEALHIAHGTRRNDPVPGFTDYHEDIADKTSKATSRRLLKHAREAGGETTHFSVVDGDGMAVSVTQSIDSYFGSKVAHPTLGFLYNNYMQSFRLEDDGSPYVLKAGEMPLSSMSATIVTRDERPLLVLGSPGSARIISAVAQVTSHWIDIGQGIEAAVGAFRVHALPDHRAWIEGPGLSTDLMAGLSAKGFELVRPSYGVSDSHLDPYFGGVHALAFEQGAWAGAADPRRDGTVGYAWIDD